MPKGVPPVSSRWQKGQSGNPAGKPKGSRHKLGEAFVLALHDDFIAHGAETIVRVREEEPAQYMRVVASLLPKEVKIETVNDVSDAELDARIARLVGVVGLEAGIAGTAAREGTQEASAEAGGVSPLH